MKRIAKFVVFGLLAAVLFTACGEEQTREDKVSAMIGQIESPFLIVNMEPQNLMDKSGVMDGVLPFTYEMILEFFIDESVTGIDYKTKAQIVVGKGKDFTPNFYGIFKVKDSKLFKDLLDKEANADLGEKDGFSYGIKEAENYCVVWNDEYAIISNIPMDFAAMLSGKGGNQGMKTVESNIDLIKSVEDAEVNERYAEFLKNDADMGMLYDGEGMYGYMKSMDSMKEDEQAMEMMETYKGMSYEMFLNFTKGSIDFEFISDLSDEVKEELSFIADDAVSSNLLKYGDTPNPIFVSTYNIKFSDFFDYFEEKMEKRDFEEMEEGLAEVGLTVEDAKKAMSGEVSMVLDRVETTTKTMDFGYGDPYTYTSTEPVFGFVAGVKDKAVIEKAMESLMNKSGAADQMDMAANMSEDEVMKALQEMESSNRGPKVKALPNGVIQMDKDAFMYLDNDAIFISNDSAWAMKVATGKGVKIKDPKGDIGKFPMAFYGNFASLAKVDNLNDAKPFVDLFVEMHGGANIDGGSFHLILKNKDKNSLRIITELIGNELNKMEQKSNPELYEELESSKDEAAEAEAEACEGGACEAGACEAGACEGGQ